MVVRPCDVFFSPEKNGGKNKQLELAPPFKISSFSPQGERGKGAIWGLNLFLSYLPSSVVQCQVLSLFFNIRLRTYNTAGSNVHHFLRLPHHLRILGLRAR